MWNITSPDGKIEVIRDSLGNPGASRDFGGTIEIPGASFRVSKRLFYDPMVFSDNSRFLAVAESFSDNTAYDNSSRVVVFDFAKQKEIIVYTEKQGGIITLRWTDDSLHIGAYSNLHGAKEHIWKRPTELG